MADAAKKKPSLAVVIEMGKGKKAPPGDDESDPDMADDDGDYSAAVDELAEVAGVPEENRDAFRDAFKAAVMSCK